MSAELKRLESLEKAFLTRSDQLTWDIGYLNAQTRALTETVLKFCGKEAAQYFIEREKKWIQDALEALENVNPALAARLHEKFLGREVPGSPWTQEPPEGPEGKGTDPQ